jgi:thioesterase domain-containing protein
MKDKSELVLIQRSTSRFPIFLVHPIGGTVFIYKSLAQLLGANYTVYGLQARGLYIGETAIDDVTHLAANYIECVRAVQPTGPYHIGGSSFGGVVAFEMAQQLNESGDQVNLLVLIDSPYVQAPLGEYEVLTRSLQFILNEKFEFPSELTGSTLEEKAEYVIESGKVPKSMDSATLCQLFKVWCANGNALHKYTPQNYDGNLHYFKAREKNENYPMIEADAWKKCAEKTVMVEVPGDHMSMLAEPHVCELAAKLRTLLNF